MSHDNNNSFIISRNNKGDNPKRPDYRGEVTIEGVTYVLAGWIRSRRDDPEKKFISGTVKPKTPPAKPTQPAQPASFAEDPDEDVPF